jgi:hypothetical protein
LQAAKLVITTSQVEDREPTQFDFPAGSTDLDCELQFLGRSERDLFARFDLDDFAGCRIATHARCSFPDLQDAEARNADALALFEMLGDEAYEIAKEALACAFGQLMLLGQGRGEVLERDGAAGLRRASQLTSFSCHNTGPLYARNALRMTGCDSREEKVN